MATLLHSYWRSGTSYRTRIALALKGLDYSQITHDLRAGEQRSPSYLALNPQGLVPVLETPEGILMQSGAIIEWLEERYPEPPLLPQGAHARAIVRGMASLIGCDIHPLNNIRVLNHLRTNLAADEEAVTAWIAHWIELGFKALEAQLATFSGRFCYGDKIGLADCYLVPQLYSAKRFGVSLKPYPNVLRVCDDAERDPGVASAHPDRQPDAD